MTIGTSGFLSTRFGASIATDLARAFVSRRSMAASQNLCFLEADSFRFRSGWNLLEPVQVKLCHNVPGSLGKSPVTVVCLILDYQALDDCSVIGISGDSFLQLKSFSQIFPRVSENTLLEMLDELLFHQKFQHLSTRTVLGRDGT